MEERQSRLSSMVWRRFQQYFCVRLIPQNSMFSNFCHVLKFKSENKSAILIVYELHFYFLRVNIVDITHNITSKNTIHHPFDSLPHKTNHNFYIAM